DSSRPERSILTLKPLPTIDPKDKGKKFTRRLQVYLQAEVERERQREEEASKASIAETYDEVKAGIDADALFAAKLQREERKESAEIRSRPPTKYQIRNLMMTYLKNMGGYKHSQLKAKTFAEIQGLYEKQKKVIDDFKPIDSDDAVKDSKEAAGVRKKKVIEEPNSTKVEVKQKTDADLEEEEKLKAYLKIVPDEEGIIDYESASTIESLDPMEVLERKYPLIKETLERMLSLRLVAETASEDAYTLLRFIQKQIDEYGNHDGELASPKQTALDKDISNPLIVDSLLKTIWLSMYLVIAMKHWLFQIKRLLGRIVGFQKFLQLSATTYTSYYCQFYLVLLMKNAIDSRK
ncbi:hypothetical protein Tco_1100601, partial [Tanacetum coccineum]